MPFRITYEPRNRISGVQPRTFTKESASEAWAEVDGLLRSDEKVQIEQVPGGPISWRELEMMAEDERGKG